MTKSRPRLALIRKAMRSPAITVGLPCLLLFPLYSRRQKKTKKKKKNKPRKYLPCSLCAASRPTTLPSGWLPTQRRATSISVSNSPVAATS